MIKIYYSFLIMAISDLFSTSFLFSIAIIIILIGGIFAYVSYRMAEQDHKLTSMVSLVSILAQDLRSVKHKLDLLGQDSDCQNIQYPSEIIGGQGPSDLISVSDGGDEYTDEEYDDDDDNTTDEEDFYVSEEDVEDEEIGDSQEHIKLLNLTLVNEDAENNSPIEDLNCDFYNEVKELDTPHNEHIKTIHLETSINFEETDVSLPLETEQNDTQISGEEDINFMTNGGYDLKNITITDLGESEDLHAAKSEYKKMSINKLREVVVSKGVVADASKLKKNEILKLLGDE
jgi:hypothetical protein